MKRKIFLAAILSFLMISNSCVKKVTREDPEDRQYVTRTDWAKDVKQAINDFIEVNKDTDDKYAVFDFDNTSVIFDIEEQLMIYQLQTMSFAMNPDELEKTISTGLENIPEAKNWVEDITKAYSYLYTTYGPFTPMGISQGKQKTVQEDPEWQEFATKLCCLYENIKDWIGSNQSYIWELCSFTGMTENEVYNLSYSSSKKFSSVETTSETWESPASIPSLVGQVRYNWTSGITVTENVKELFEALDNYGIDVWICSSSGIQQVMAAVDAMDLHRHCTGVIAVSIKKDSEGKYIPELADFGGKGYIVTGETTWQENQLYNGAISAGAGKVTCILNAISPLYNETGPSAGFMDSTGDFNFCTEFSSLQLVVCMNRGDREITDGGGLIAEIAIYEKETLEYDFEKANVSGDTFYVLQGRDENGKRSLRNSNATMRLGKTTENLFANEDNYAQLQEMIDNQLTVKQALDKYSSAFLTSYPGYHSR